MTVEELRTWWADWQIEPWGDDRTEASVAIMGSAVCGALGGRIEADKLIPKWNRHQQRGMSADEFVAAVNNYNERNKQ
jgi:hypothetical protein